MGSGEWVDKVMVNKQEIANKVENSLGCWEEENRLLPDVFYQKYLQDPSKLYSEQPYNMFAGRNRFDIANTDDLDEDAATSDSSEPDLLWQFNHAKLPTIANGIGAKIKKSSPKPGKSSEIR